ncbi:hypothetical protein D9757_002426 [Collybiopsis confluens]|uniref:Alpha/beta hydrolase fold-3 domain-containing protein n=1 Tax=Collybiopsis confluens TaxID=2823264 RepID=A0A8H5MF30_9AGAR|nr:hypothetical protein D9757_002426 [Collybiopsis confluens]
MSATPIEIVFKKAGGLDLYIDVYLSPKATPENPSPILIWWHAGGMLMGTRKHVAPHHQRATAEYNVTFVSAEYRLSPQFRMPTVLTDCVDAVNFLSSEEFKKATGGRTDPSRIILNGSSVGGWISQIVGNSIGFKEAGIAPVIHKDSIKGIVSVYPMTNLEDEFFKKQYKPLGIIGAAVGLPEDRIIADEEVARFIDPENPDSRTANAPFDGPRTLLYFYAVQEGIVEKLLLGGTGLSGSVFSVPQHFRNLSSAEGVPPIYLIHGDSDGSVPVTSSQHVAAAVRALGHKDFTYVELKGVDHLYDQEPEESMEGMYVFIKRILKL